MSVLGSKLLGDRFERYAHKMIVITTELAYDGRGIVNENKQDFNQCVGHKMLRISTM